MNIFFILVCLPLLTAVRGQEVDGDWKIQFKILSDRLDQKENEINLLKGRVDMLEKRDDDICKQSKISTNEEEIHGSTEHQWLLASLNTELNK